MDRPPMPGTAVEITGETGAGEVRVIEGLVGEAVRYIELAEDTGLTRAEIHAPLGVFVVSFGASDQVHVRFLDNSEATIREVMFRPSANLD